MSNLRIERLFKIHIDGIDPWAKSNFVHLPLKRCLEKLLAVISAVSTLRQRSFLTWIKIMRNSLIPNWSMHRIVLGQGQIVRIIELWFHLVGLQAFRISHEIMFFCFLWKIIEKSGLRIIRCWLWRKQNFEILICCQLGCSIEWHFQFVLQLLIYGFQFINFTLAFLLVNCKLRVEFVVAFRKCPSTFQILYPIFLFGRNFTLMILCLNLYTFG